MKRTAIIVLTCLLVGGGLAYLAGYLVYAPQLEDHLTKINDQYDEISRLVQVNCDLEHAVVSQEALLSSQQAEIATQKQIIASKDTLITSLELEKNSLQEQLSDAELELRQLKGE